MGRARTVLDTIPGASLAVPPFVADSRLHSKLFGGWRHDGMEMHQWVRNPGSFESFFTFVHCVANASHLVQV